MTRTYSTDGPECPYCGERATPDDRFYYDDRNTENECGECGQTYKMEINNWTSWTCRAADAEPSA